MARGRRLILGAALAASLAIAAPPVIAAEPAPSIGVATMAPDGTITLYLRATDHGIRGDGRLIYHPGDPHYEEVLRHLGGMKPGETKSVPPWP